MSVSRILSICLAVMVLCPSSARADISKPRSWWAEVFSFKNYDRQDAIEDLSREIVREISPGKDAPFFKRVHAARRFVYRNSTNIMDDAMYSYWTDIPQQLIMLRTHSKNSDKPLPHMECSMRTVVMYFLLKEMNITSRIIIAHPGKNKALSHTFLEVYNPKTNSWSVEDPLLNIEWQFRDSGKRASVEDLLTYPVHETFVPCRTKTGCGYTPEIENMLPYFALTQIVDPGSTHNPVMINPDRYNTADLKEFFSKPGPYCDILVGGCSHDVIKIQSQPALNKTAKP